MKKEVKIDYLFLDLQTCERCIGTDKVLYNDCYSSHIKVN